MEKGEDVSFRVGGWLPSDEKFLATWLGGLLGEVEADMARAPAERSPLHPVIKEFEQLIDDDPAINMLFTYMLEQVPYKYVYTPDGKPQVKTVEQMLRAINKILTMPPEYNTTDLVGFPINAILNWAMGTHAGFAAFLNRRVNDQFKKVLNVYGEFLASLDSTKWLAEHNSGVPSEKYWFSEDALKALLEAAGEKPGEELPKQFGEVYECNLMEPHYGFTSWDAFFARTFKSGKRPINDEIKNNKDAIVNACEAAPYRLAYYPSLRDKFWLKGQPYSVKHILNNHPKADFFAQGVIYQAFLSALSYHRWHSPVDGVIREAYVIDGTYYSETPDAGFDPAAPNASQAYITEVATRAVIMIQAGSKKKKEEGEEEFEENENIGLMCFLAVGMAEVSSCEITVKLGDEVKKGDQLGAFHFGGSTYCLMFQNHKRILFELDQTPSLKATNIKVNKMIARAYPPK